MSIRPMKAAAIATTALALVMTGSARADWWDNQYWGFGAGYQFNPTDDLSFTTSEPDNGWLGTLAIGGNISRSWRNELELSRWWNEIDPGPPVGTWIDGDYSVTALTYNLIWDWNPGGGINPYVAAGAGPAFWAAQGTGAPGWNIDDSGWGLAGILRAGFDFGLGSGVRLNTEYRYSGVVPVGVRTPLGEFDENFVANSIVVGLRFPMGPTAAPPPPPPPPPPVTTSTMGPYKVYFQWDKYNLTKEAQATIDEVAAQVRNKKIQRVHIEGDTDTSGSNEYNQRLSDMRAAAVRDRLIADGVPANLIDTVGLGETNPAVKTGDNVKEPLNRRAEITITISNQ